MEGREERVAIRRLCVRHRESFRISGYLTTGHVLAARVLMTHPSTSTLSPSATPRQPSPEAACHRETLGPSSPSS